MIVEYLLVAVLGLTIYWLLELVRAKRNQLKKKMPFYWNVFIQDNLISFIISSLYVVAMFLLVDKAVLKQTEFPYMAFIRMDMLVFFTAGMAGSTFLNQMIRSLIYMVTAKKD